MVLVTPPGLCCFQLDELAAIQLRLHECVKRYVEPLAIVVWPLPYGEGLFVAIVNREV